MITKEQKGFTLIEILIVVAIIAILASVVLVGLGPTQKEGRDSRRISDLSEVQNALELYYNHCGNYPGPASSPGNSCGAWSAMTPGSNAYYEDMKADVTGLTDVGVPQIPEDPTNAGSLVYVYETNSPNSYTLAATLEDTGNAVLKSDETTDPNGSLTCGKGGLYCLSL